MVGDPTTKFIFKELPSGGVTLHDQELDETFHPGLGAEREASLLYIEPTQLEKQLCESQDTPLVIWDVGLGAAGNALAVMNLWKKLGDLCKRDILIYSFDLHTDALHVALEHHEKNRAIFRYLEGWNWNYILQNKGGSWNSANSKLTWHWHITDFPKLMNSKHFSPLSPDQIFYDAHSPPKNYCMWRLDHFERIRFFCNEAKTSTLIFHSRSTAVRVTLLLAGFYVGVGPILGDKEETTIATNKAESLDQPLNQVWLERVRRSTAANPFVKNTFSAGKIEDRWLIKLEKHSQWALS